MQKKIRRSGARYKRIHRPERISYMHKDASAQPPIYPNSSDANWFARGAFEYFNIHAHTYRGASLPER